ncbi:MAG: protein phosphatase 2C domain-containing protein [Ktedonobacterales bacterium]
MDQGNDESKNLASGLPEAQGLEHTATEDLPEVSLPASQYGSPEASSSPEHEETGEPAQLQAATEAGVAPGAAEIESTDELPGDSMPEPKLPEMQPRPENDAPPPNEQLGEALEIGTLVGPYVIERLLRSTPDEHTYLAVGIRQDGERGSYVTLIERTESGFSTNLMRLIAIKLKHPRLLVPRALFPLNAREYVVVENLIGEDGEPARLVSEGGRLPLINTLTAGAGLADALNYLHRNGITHLHISPDAVVIFNGRAYLIGLEQASYFDPDKAESAALIARDANFLARTMAVIGNVPPGEVPDEDLLQDNLRRIAAYGERDGFESPGELAGACSAALESVAHALPDLTSDTPAQITLDIGSATTVGRVRSQNQDACASATFEIADDRSHGEPVGIFLVADGMGGEARGEWASRIAARLVLAEMAAHFALPSVTEPALDLEGNTNGGSQSREEYTAPREERNLTRSLVRAVERANQQIRELAQQLGKVTGTTLTAVAVQGQHASLAHLGDSRAYLLRGDVMVKLTEDHSVLARLQALDHPLLSDPDMFIPRNTLYRSLGQEEQTIPDTLEFMLAPHDRLLICSDGLWDELDSQVLAQTLAGSSDPRDCAEQLVRLANAAGGNDNSTALAVFVYAVPADADRLTLTEAWSPG